MTMDWEEYWQAKKVGKRPFYDIIASLYRFFIIRRSLNYFIKKYAKKENYLLHAGSGSGEVDKDLIYNYKIFAIDSSAEAMNINRVDNYKVRGDIFFLPFRDNTFDIVYNLGVLEHFSRGEIIKLLCEFKRVLKKKGYLIVFIPPEFGLTVVFFKLLKKFLKIFMRREVEFHPKEPSRLKSKKEALEFLDESGLKLKEYYFGIRDLFTYSVIIAEK